MVAQTEDRVSFGILIESTLNLGAQRGKHLILQMENEYCKWAVSYNKELKNHVQQSKAVSQHEDWVVDFGTFEPGIMNDFGNVPVV